jgi:hypothetical protein
MPPPPKVMIDKFLFGTQCATDEERIYLKLLLGNKLFVTTLIYRGSVHGRLPSDFHRQYRLYDKKGATITLVKIYQGSCIGGKTNA